MNPTKEFQLLKEIEAEFDRAAVNTDAEETVEELRRNVTSKILSQIKNSLKENADAAQDEN